MQYLGGKSRIAKELGSYLRGRLEGRFFVEPFCGGLSVSAEMRGSRLASDASLCLFTLYKALREGWDPPAEVSEDMYARHARIRDPLDPMTAFVGYGCSFAGKFFAGMARSRTRNFAAAARRSLLRKKEATSESTFACASYERLSPDRRCLVYCDPPYADTTGYAACGVFDSEAFWMQAANWADAGVLVLVSEYKAPPGWVPVWEKAVETAMHGKGREGRMEKLFERAPL